MNGTIVARVRRVMVGHSERALIHAVDDENLEYKIEVPAEAVRNLVPGQQHSLTLSWTLQPLTPGPASREAAAPLAAQAPTPLPSKVDEEFMALMARRRGQTATSPTSTIRPNPPPPTSGAPVATSAADQLAERLGLGPRRTTT